MQYFSMINCPLNFCALLAKQHSTTPHSPTLHRLLIHHLVREIAIMLRLHSSNVLRLTPSACALQPPARPPLALLCAFVCALVCIHWCDGICRGYGQWCYGSRARTAPLGATQRAASSPWPASPLTALSTAAPWLLAEPAKVSRFEDICIR